MKIVKEYIKYYRILVAFSLLAVLFAVEIKAMRMSPKAMQYSKALTKRRQDRLDNQVKKLGSNEFLVYQPGTDNSIVVSAQVAKKSDFLTLIFDSLSGNDDRKFAIKEYTISQVKIVHDIINDWLIDKNKEEKAIENLSLQDLLSRINLLNVFGVSHDIVEPSLEKIRTGMIRESVSINDLKELLHVDLQKSLMLIPTIDWLKNLIIETKKVDYPSVVIKDNIASYIELLSFSPDGKKFVCTLNWLVPDKRGLMLYNIENLEQVTTQLLGGNEHLIKVIAFSPDGKKVISGGPGEFVLYDIINLKRFSFKDPGYHIGTIKAVAFSPNGNKIVSGGVYGGKSNLIVWDIDNLTPQPLLDFKDNVNAVAFSPNGKAIVFSCTNTQTKINRLILFDLTNNASHELLGSSDVHAYFVIHTIAFSPDGNKIITGDSEQNIFLMDMDYSKSIITSRDIILSQADENLGDIKSLAFSSDGSKVYSCHISSADFISFNRMRFIIWNVSDLKNVTDQRLIFKNTVHAVAYSPDGNKIVFAGYNHGNYSLILFNLLTNEELSVVNKLKEYNVDQLRLVYELCLRLLSGQVIPSNRCDEVKKTFETLPTDMKELLYKLKLFNKESVSSQGWFSGCALF